MLRRFKKAASPRLLVLALACLLMALTLSGCQTIGFYRQAIAGEYEILAHQQPIPDLITNSQTTPALKTKFEQVLQIRRFAEQNLSLPAHKQYLNYVDLHRPYVVWNVNVAPALSLTPKTWWFPIIGRASYRGYFVEEQARRYAANFEKKGWDVYVDGVETYSTLGWFHDPILNTFINEPESYLAEVIFHELTHQRLFVAGDTEFNESLATFVSEEGVHRWFQASNHPEGYDRYHQGLERERDFVQLVISARNRLQAVYSDNQLTDAAKLQRKSEVIEQLRADYAALKTKWGEKKSGYDHWFAEPINNAKLNTVSAYFDLVPGFRALLGDNRGDLNGFFAAAEKLAKLPPQARHDALHRLAASGVKGAQSGSF
jgi:predicted aminopeptidase